MPIEQKIWALDSKMELMPSSSITEKELEDTPRAGYIIGKNEN